MRVDKFYISDGFLETGITYITGITEAISAGSTDNEIPTAKAVYDYTVVSAGEYWTSGTTTGSIKTIAGGNTSTGSYSYAEGYQTTAQGARAHTEGIQTRATGTNSHAEGGITLAGGINSHAQNNNTYAQGESSHAGGKSTQLSYQILAQGVASFNHSYKTDASIYGATGDYSAILGGINNSATGEGTIIIGGSGITADKDYTLYCSNLQNNGAMFVNVTEVSTSSYTATESDYIIHCVSATTITIPTDLLDYDGRILNIRNATDSSSVSVITEGSEQIDNEDTQTVSATNLMKIYSMNSNWWIG